MQHFFYFPRKADAEKLGERLSNGGFTVEIQTGADGNWLLLATTLSEHQEQTEDDFHRMEELAAEFGGEYDGFEEVLDVFDPGMVN